MSPIKIGTLCSCYSPAMFRAQL